MDWDLYRPSGVTDAPLVILSHGFQRSRAEMAGWAQHLASWGVTVVTPGLCHASIFDTDHAQNGQDLADLAASQGVPAVFAGQSAGGLASMLAGANHPDTIGVFGLDPVDNAGQGAASGPSLQGPMAALLAESSACNSQNNAINMMSGVSEAWLLRVPGTTHCSYENPTSGTCTTFCGGAGPSWSEEAIGGLMTAWILWQTGLDATGEAYWTPGEPTYEQLLSAGWIAPI